MTQRQREIKDSVAAYGIYLRESMMPCFRSTPRSTFTMALDGELETIVKLTAAADEWDWDMERVNYMMTRTSPVASTWPMFRFQLGLG